MLEAGALTRCHCCLERCCGEQQLRLPVLLLLLALLLLHHEGCSLALSHILPEYNTCAGELTHPDFEGFDPALRLETPADIFQFSLWEAS